MIPIRFMFFILIIAIVFAFIGRWIYVLFKRASDIQDEALKSYQQELYRKGTKPNLKEGQTWIGEDNKERKITKITKEEIYYKLEGRISIQRATIKHFITDYTKGLKK